MNALVASLICLAFSSSPAFTASGPRSNILSYIYGPMNDLPLPKLAKSLGLSTLVKFLDVAELTGALSKPGTFTLFAPTDEAFKNLPPGLAKYLENNITALADVLKYHVLSVSVFSKDITNEELAPTLEGKSIRANKYGEVITIDGAKVTKPDLRASNGVLHVIDKVLLPPGGSLVELAIGCPKLSTLVKAVTIAGLVDTLNGSATLPLTLFTPMDSAFAKIPQEDLEKLLHDKTALTNVLTYHVINGTFYSAGLRDGDVPTLNGQTVNVKVSGEGVTLNGNVKVILADVTATNGVAHAIDTVLMPKSMTFDEIIARPNPRSDHVSRDCGRGNSKTLFVQRPRLDVRKHNFSVRSTNIWNSLPDDVVCAKSLISFKNKLDKFWRNQEVLYDYKADIRTGSRINNCKESESSEEDPTGTCVGNHP
ncbi:hypothetical protein FSP39_012058 [Pinctada imbricata]|uniref:FAS1 domain-containing protein n=1 Tax=Pinctada imbricata TaxID=66713 RepID=A0AA89BZL7_PINIB|nr:hypothetical protein FSP39_012058 [Pinctada imbricata]